MRTIFGVLLLGLFAALGLPSALGANGDPQRTVIEHMLEPSQASQPQYDPAHQTESLRTLYQRRMFKLLWSVDGKASRQTLALVQTLRHTEVYGLPTEVYGGDSLAAQLQSLTANTGRQAEDWARFDVALSIAALRLLSHLHYGRIDPGVAGFELGSLRSDLNAVAILEQLARANNVEQVIAAAEPHFYHYDLLKQTLRRYRLLATQPALNVLPRIATRSIKPGDVYEGAPALRKLLAALGDLSGADIAPDSDPTLDPELATALKKFQERHGLKADGAIGKATFAALTTPFSQRVRQIELTLERWRWLPSFDTPPIIVNIPQFKLFAFRSTADRKADILQMDVIVGQTYRRTRTPVFAADLKYVIFRPYWDVPYSIMKNELLPKIRAHPAYLEEQHLEIVNGQSDAAKPVPPTAENLSALAAGKLRLRQRPGADNALGLIKFMLPNAYNVYLHSTPARELFEESRRAFSHGCIRVSDPVGLAVHVLRNAPEDWTPEAVEAAMNAASSQRVNLSQSIRVMILYGTAMATEGGTDLFFDDIYGYDRKLETLLGLTPSGA